MKIGVVLAEVERWSSYHGGAVARYAYEIIQNKNEGDYDITVFGQSCQSQYQYSHKLIQPGKSIIRLDYFATKIRTGFAGWLYILSIYNKLKKNDIIHIHNRPFYAMICRKLGYRGKIIVHLHNDFNKSSISYAKRFINASDVIISCSQKIADRLFEKFPEATDKSKVIYNGVDDENFTYSPWGKRENQILYIGRINEIKGIHNLLDAYKKIIIKYPDWKLKLVGSATFGGATNLTDYEILIQQKLDEINNLNGKVEHAGYVHHVELPKLFHESKIFCMPSIVHEAFSLAIAESMFCGTPVIGTTLGGVPEVIGEAGLLCEPNLQSLYELLLEYIENEELLERNSIAGYQRVKNKFTWAIVAAHQFTVYDNLINE